MKGGSSLKNRIFIKKAVAAAAAFLIGIQPSVNASGSVRALSQNSQYDYIYSDTVPEIFEVPENSYSDYYDRYYDEPRPDDEIYVHAADYVTAVGEGFSKGVFTAGETKNDVLIWNGNTGKLTYEIYVPATGMYNLEMSYCPIVSNTSSIEMSVLIDGEVPYDTASRLTLPKVWINERPITENSDGNQLRPPQVQSGMWMKSDFKDTDGLFSDPLFFRLEKGKHTITFDAQKAFFALEYFRFCNHDQILSFSETGPDIPEIKSTPSSLIRIEGEDAAFKSDSTLYPTSDSSSYLASPARPGKIIYNTIGADNWKKSLQTVTWTIPGEKIGSDGWYRLGIKGRQQTMRGLYSNRRIYIDGEVPYSEFDQVKFYYDTDWQLVIPQTSDGNDVYVYLTAGEDHMLSMEAIPGEIGGAIRKLEPLVLDINQYYRDILMVTGPSPDKYTDYNIDTAIPELVSEFKRISSELKQVKNDIEQLADSKGSEAAGIERMYVILDKCTEDPYRIPGYLQQLRDNVAAISSWMRDYRDQPLEIDYIELASGDSRFSSVEEKFFDSLAFGARSFINSFFEDYQMLSDTGSDEALNVWINLGRDQALAVKELVDSEFVPEYGIPVNLSIVQGAVVEATLAGKGPDIAMFVGGELPVNLAARGLLTDLSGFDGVSEIRSNMNENATVMYEYNGGLYGIPLEQYFPVMFYRKDILGETGLQDIPHTWTDLTSMLPLLQRNHLNTGLVLPSANVSPATEPGHTFAMLMLQNGLNYYNTGQTETNFGDIRAVQAFEQWTDLYSKYRLEQTYDPFSRFRDGTYPLVIQNYTFCNQLEAAAPELNGLWDFAPVPGTEDADGNISHAANSSGSGMIVFNKVKNKDDAWQFLKWFASTETQIRYGTAVEGLLGTLGRYASANSEVIKNLSWTPAETEKILQQWNELEEIPVIPASYAVTRNIMTAFRITVNEHENPRDTIMWYDRDINAEIKRKRKNLGLN